MSYSLSKSEDGSFVSFSLLEGYSREMKESMGEVYCYGSS